MTRRKLLWLPATAFARTRPAPPPPVVVPIHRITDALPRYAPEDLSRFWSVAWPEAVREFARSGIQLQTTDGPGMMRHTAGDRPIFLGLRRGVLNLFLTDHVPMIWDRGRALAGVSAIYDGYHLCLIGARFAHGNQVPFFSVNTCVHEMLHAFLQDVFVSNPEWYQAGGREARIDWQATRLWLFHDGGTVRESARLYVNRLRAPRGS